VIGFTREEDSEEGGSENRFMPQTTPPSYTSRISQSGPGTDQRKEGGGRGGGIYATEEGEGSGQADTGLMLTLRDFFSIASICRGVLAMMGKRRGKREGRVPHHIWRKKGKRSDEYRRVSGLSVSASERRNIRRWEGGGKAARMPPPSAGKSSSSSALR